MDSDEDIIVVDDPEEFLKPQDEEDSENDDFIVEDEEEEEEENKDDVELEDTKETAMDIWEPVMSESKYISGESATYYIEYKYFYEFDEYEMGTNAQKWCDDREMEQKAREYISMIPRLFRREIEVISINEVSGGDTNEIGYCFFKFDNATELYNAIKGPIRKLRGILVNPAYSLQDKKQSEEWADVLMNCLLDPPIQIRTVRNLTTFLGKKLHEITPDDIGLKYRLTSLSFELLEVQNDMINNISSSHFKKDELVANVLQFCIKKGVDEDEAREAVLHYLSYMMIKMNLIIGLSLDKLKIKVHLDSSLERYEEDARFYKKMNMKSVGIISETPETFSIRLSDNILEDYDNPNDPVKGDFKWIKRNLDYNGTNVEYVDFSQVTKMELNPKTELSTLVDMCEEIGQGVPLEDYTLDQFKIIASGNSVHNYNLILTKVGSTNAGFMIFGFNTSNGLMSRVYNDFVDKVEFMKDIVRNDLFLTTKNKLDVINKAGVLQQIQWIDLLFSFVRNGFLPKREEFTSLIKRWLSVNGNFLIDQKKLEKVTSIIYDRYDNRRYYRPKYPCDKITNHVYLVCVSVPFRKKGLVRKMMDYAAETTREFASFVSTKSAFITLEPAPTNPSLPEYYRKLGFETVKGLNNIMESFDLLKEPNRKFDSQIPIVTCKLGSSHFSGEYNNHYIVYSDGLSWMIKDDKTRYCEHEIPEEEMIKWLVTERNPHRDKLCLICNFEKLSIK